MIAMFTPLLLGDGGELVSASCSTSTRTLVLGGLLALYPTAQLFGAPVLGSLSAISTALPLPVMGARALLGSGLLARPAAREAAAPVTES